MKTLPLNKPIPPLLFCIIMDLIGCVSFSIPGVGEFADIIWAPLSAYLFMKSFGDKFGKVGAVLNFIEEALPFTDIIPSFSIAWCIKKYL